MSVSLTLSEDLTARLQEIAAREGISIDELVSSLVQEQLTQLSEGSQEKREIHLLQQINLGISPKTWERYHALRTVRDAEQLTEVSHQELIVLSEQIEAANVKRMQALVSLAKLRNTDLGSLMQELGLSTPAYG